MEHDNDIFNVLFIGAGNITFGNDNVLWNHSLRIENHLGARLRVVGIVDPSTERVQQVLDQKRQSIAAPCYERTRHFRNVQEAAKALEDSSLVPQLIILGSPPHFRGTLQEGRNLEQQIISAFTSKPAIFCEKPVATARPVETLNVTKLLQESGNTISVGYMLRYLQVVQKAVQIIKENNLTVMSVAARYTCAYQKIRKFDWWNKSQQCGPIVEQATHFCDLMRYLGGEVMLDTVQAIALEHYEKAGKLRHQAIDESKIAENDRLPRVTTALWKYETGAIGSLTHIIALHGIRYSNEMVVTADGYQLRLVDLYTNPTLYFRTPISAQEEVITFVGDDPFFSELAALIDVVDEKVTKAGGAAQSHEIAIGTALPETVHGSSVGGILSDYSDACKTYELTWRIRDASEESSLRFKRK